MQGNPPPSTTPAWPSDCFLQHIDYYFLNNIATMDNVQDAMACQDRCKMIIDCEKFTFHYKGELAGNCYLKKDTLLSSEIQKEIETTISGPRYC